MGLRCGLIGLPSCGKTVIFNAITAARVPAYNGSEMNRIVGNGPDERMERLAPMYHPRKVTPSTLEVVDIPGIKAEDNGRGSRLLGNIKDMEALLHVVRCFEDKEIPFAYDTVDPTRDVETVELELLAADSATLGNKIDRLAKKVRSGDKDAVRESTHCEKVRAAIQQGIPVRKQT